MPPFPVSEPRQNKAWREGLVEMCVASVRKAATDSSMAAVATEALRALTNLCVDDRGKPDARNQTAAVKEEAFVAVRDVLTQFRTSPAVVEQAARAVRSPECPLAPSCSRTLPGARASRAPPHRRRADPRHGAGERPQPHPGRARRGDWRPHRRHRRAPEGRRRAGAGIAPLERAFGLPRHAIPLS